MRRSLVRCACYVAAMIVFAGAACETDFAQTTPTLTVDAAGNPHPINPDIYGIASYGLDAGFAKEIQVSNVRWGGDATTRYNWEVDSSNAGFDWYFMGGNGEATPVPSASADLMINTYKAASNAHALMTIPIIPYVNKTAAWNCSFPVSVYGPQQSTNPYVHPNGDSCGNSIATNGTQLLDNNIYANHIDNTTALQQGWVQHLITTFGTAANGGVPYYQLDNEPGGWSNTHRDVEPTQPDYNTLINLGQQYATMIKQTDPSAKVFGPVDFTLGGWIGTPAKQNNLYAGQYYLQQMAAYDAANHQRLLDYFDEHYYGGGSTDALQLADTRSLWDPTYNSGTWVEQYYFDGPMMLLPRFESWIQTYYPGTKLSISEYSFAMGTNPLVDMLTETDVLGIYGRQGLDFANMWNVPKPTDPLAYSFRVYRDYDGAGGQFGDTSVNSTSTDQGQLSVYGALRSSDGALTVVAINKTTSAIQTSLTLANFNSTPNAAVYTYSNANLTQIVAGAPVLVSSNSISYNFAAYSATVFVFTPAAATLAPTTTTVTASSTQLTAGQSVTITVTVASTSGGGTPTGTANYFDGASEILTSGISSSGQSTLTTSGLAVGAHSITARYLGDTNFAGSTSAPLVINVSAAAKTATTTSLSASATQVTSGQTVTFTATVAPKSGSGVATGTLTFGDGTTQIGTGTLNASGTATLATASLAVGSHAVTAAYSGDTNYSPSTSSAVSVVVSAPAKVGTLTSLSASATQLTSGQSVTFTAGVAPQSGSGVPTGSVNFLDGASQIASAALSAGSASFSSTGLAVGTHTITAAYSGDTNYTASNSAAMTVIVAAAPAPDYSLSLSSSSLTIAQGASGTLTITVTPKNGFKQALGLACSGLPTGGNCSFNPRTVNASAGAATTMLTVQAPAAAAADEPFNIPFPGPRNALYILALVGMMGVAGKRRAGTRMASFAPIFLACVAFAALLVTASCAGYSKQSDAQPTSYLVTVTASGANAATHSEQFTLNVQP
jgi:hypothetical protein